MEQPVEKVYTYADLAELSEDVRAELIYGDLYMMAPPSRIHQKIQGELYGQIWEFLKDKRCEVYTSDFGVRLFDEDDDLLEDSETLVIPDITVVYDHSKLDDAGCKGAPDMIVEILSPSNGKHDRVMKKMLYERAKVREFWIIDPVHYTVEVFLLDVNGKFSNTATYGREDTASVNVLPGCEIDLSRVFPEPEVPRKRKVL